MERKMLNFLIVRNSLKTSVPTLLGADVRCVKYVLRKPISCQDASMILVEMPVIDH